MIKNNNIITKLFQINNNIIKNEIKRNYIHVDGCFNIEKINKQMNNSSTSTNGSISIIKNRVNGPLSLYDLESFNENGFIIKNNIIFEQKYQNSFIEDVSNNNNNIYESSDIKSNQDFLNSFSQLFQITYSNSYKSNNNNNNNNNNIEYSEWPNLYNNFSSTDILLNINKDNNNKNNKNREKIINLDCNPFSLFKTEIINKDKIIESVPLKKWTPINSILYIGDDDSSYINLIPKYHKKSIKYICEKYSKEKRNLSKNPYRPINSTSELYKHDTDLISQLKEIHLKKGDLIYYDSRLPYCIISNNNNNNSNIENKNNSFIYLNYLPNISINKI
ncbi:hypothetical protein RB653_009492 [Dictyostelium firmibasis]|uniref:Uncharacterized protein n=1 Tax=Dictyostelium firmibasis TaxID=79012 RepID=A0AAN7U1Y0_9MYCE